MEYNKEEARKAMEIAEMKLSKKDYIGAKKFVSKANKLYPKLDGLRQVSTMVNVYVSASNPNKRGGGESDWYGILNVDPLADYVTVKKQYKKLALLLHPDNNKFNGAKEAFNLVLGVFYLITLREPPMMNRENTKNNNKSEKLLVPLQTTKETNAEEAERRCENPMKRANENSTDEAERLFKRPALITTGNSNCTSEAERLFKKRMEAAKPNSTSEAKRLFGFSRSL